MTDPTPRPPIETEISIDAPIEAVWKALTDGHELANWFPLEARVKPGVGGSVWVSWGDFEAESPIGVWEENRHLQLIYAEPSPGSADPPMPPIPFRIAVDYHLRAEGGSTVLRVVHSGFARGEGWDDQYDGTVRGWAFELRGLKHYLEQHPGRRRTVVRAKQQLDASIDLTEAWTRLVGPGGMTTARGSLDSIAAGERYEITTAKGLELCGEILIPDAPRGLAATVENLNDGLLRIRIDPSCFTAPGAQVNVFLSTYDLPQEQTDALGGSLQEMLTGLFGAVPSA